jgi:ABC-type polysaccharide/polyol phosphate transport system ATPase subunit
MGDCAVEFSAVSKQFFKGDRTDSLRDFLPAAANRLLKRRRHVKQQFYALSAVSASITRGDSFAVIGPNGSGKSTFLKLICGILSPNQGRVAVRGKLGALIDLGAGFHPDLTGRENVFLNSAILGMSIRETKSKLDSIIAFSELEDFIDMPVKRYSSGMYARLGFSVAAHVDPDILVIDEVLSVGDWTFQQRCLEYLKWFIKSGRTVVFVSHDLRAVSQLCNKAMLLEGGKVKALGDSAAVLGEYLSGPVRQSRPENAPCYFTAAALKQKYSKASYLSGEQMDCSKLAVTVSVYDESGLEVFNTSSTRLGYAPIKLLADQSFDATFNLTLHLARGRYLLASRLKQIDRDVELDAVARIATIFVHNEHDIRGIADLKPSFKCNGSAQQ